MRPLTIRQKKFAREYYRTGNATQSAIKVGYKPKGAQPASSRLLSYGIVKQEIDRLALIDEEKTIVSVTRRKAILSKIAEEIGGHDPADYIESNQHGVSIRFDKDSPNRQAVAGIKSRQEFNQDGDPIATVTDLKLRDPTIAIRAIDQLNRMEGIYNDDKDQSRVQVVLVVQAPDGQPQQITGKTIQIDSGPARIASPEPEKEIQW